MRAPGAGPDHELVFVDRVVVTLVALRFQLPHVALAELYRVDRSSVTRAIRETRPLPAARGFAVSGHPDLRLRTLADVFAYAAAEGVELRIDGTEVQVRGPHANKPSRRAYVSRKKKVNTKKATVVTDGEGRTGAWPRSSPTRSRPRRSSRRGTRHRRRSPPGTRSVTSNPRNGSA